MGYLIDTCIWVAVEQGRLSPADVAGVTGSAPVYLSPVTIAELQAGVELAADADLRQRRNVALRRLRTKPLLPIDGATAEVMGSLVASIKRGGRGSRYRVQDLWLASQAVQHGFPLVTRNAKDFDDVPGLDLIIL